MSDLEEVKMNLRSVLSASPGTKQSNLLKDYEDILQEKLNFRKFGFTSLFSFLKSLEGEVTRMEFSEELKDNILYGVIDKTKYASQHAVKYTEKYGTGIPAKSPEEIAEFLRSATRTGQSQPKKKQNKILTSLTRKNLMKPIEQSKPVEKEEFLPSVKEWDLLSRFKIDPKGFYLLTVENIGVGPHLTLNQNDLQAYFAEFNPMNVSFAVSKDRRFAIIAFSKYIDAFKAWLNKRSTVHKGQRIGCFPRRAMGVDFRKYYFVLASQLPDRLLMSTLVETFTVYPGLSQIIFNYKMRCAELYYTSETSAQNAASCVVQIRSKDGRLHNITVRYLKVENESTNQGGALLPTPKNVAKIPPLMQQKEALLPTPSKVTPTNPFLESVNKKPTATPTAAPQKEEEKKDEIEEEALQYAHMKCSFSFNYLEWRRMFQKTCNKPSKTVENIPTDIEFLVTFHSDPSNFWILRLDDPKATYEKLDEIETELEKDMKRIKPLCEHPKTGTRGAALYSRNEKWYRCWVMSSDEQKDEIKVFFCDYGNIETTGLKDYRSTYSATWSLPPMAIPCVMKGYDTNEGNKEEGLARFNDLVEGKRLKAKIAKEDLEYQPHIMELEKINCGESGYLEEIMFNEKYIVKTGGEQDPTFENDISSDLKHENIENENLEDENFENIVSDLENTKECLYDYDDDQLVIGMFVEVHKTSLMYVYLGALDGFNELDKLLSNLPYPPKALVEKNALLIHIDRKQKKRRVIVMDVGGKQAKVLQVDFGVIEWVSCNDLYDITDEIYDYPFQARPAQLAGIVPVKEKQAVEFLRAMLKTPLKFNIIDTHESGKVEVEVFDAQQQIKTSVNKQLIEKGFAQEENKFAKDDENKSFENRSVANDSLFATENISTPPRKLSNSSSVGAAVTPQHKFVRKISNSSISSWNSDANFSNVGFKNDSVEKWIDTTENVRSRSPSFPPPDIVTSSKLPSFDLCEGVRIEGNVVIFGSKETGGEEHIEFSDSDTLNEEKVELMREKWSSEKEKLLSVKQRLLNLSELDPKELNKIYREKKKEKLRAKIRIKELERELEVLRLEIENVNQETEDMLSQI